MPSPRNVSMTCPFLKNAEKILHIFGVFVIEHRHERTEEGGTKGARALRVREHDVRRAERPTRQMRVQVRPCWEDSPCKGVVEPETMVYVVLCKCNSSEERIKK
jgi:hypothetical protein